MGKRGIYIEGFSSGTLCCVCVFFFQHYFVCVCVCVFFFHYSCSRKHALPLNRSVDKSRENDPRLGGLNSHLGSLA